MDLITFFVICFFALCCFLAYFQRSNFWFDYFALFQVCVLLRWSDYLFICLSLLVIFIVNFIICSRLGFLFFLGCPLLFYSFVRVCRSLFFLASLFPPLLAKFIYKPVIRLSPVVVFLLLLFAVSSSIALFYFYDFVSYAFSHIVSKLSFYKSIFTQYRC